MCVQRDYNSATIVFAIRRRGGGLSQFGRQNCQQGAIGGIFKDRTDVGIGLTEGSSVRERQKEVGKKREHSRAYFEQGRLDFTIMRKYTLNSSGGMPRAT